MKLNEVLQLINEIKGKDVINEDVYPNYIVGYHRTNYPIEKFIEETNENGIDVNHGGGVGARFGTGFYLNLTWNETMKNKRFGVYVMKILVRHKNIISFVEKDQIKIFGKKLNIAEQLDYWNIKITPQQRELCEKYENNSAHARLFIMSILFKGKSIIDRTLVKQLPVKAIIYDEKNDDKKGDGYSVVLYDMENVSIEGYFDQRDDSENPNYLIKVNHNFHNKTNMVKGKI